jgi:hypothetical protein
MCKVLREVMGRQIGSDCLKLMMVRHGDKQIIGGAALPRFTHTGDNQTGHAMISTELAAEALARRGRHD